MARTACGSICPDVLCGDLSSADPIIDEVTRWKDLSVYDGKYTMVDVVSMNFACYSMFKMCVLQRLNVFMCDGCQ